MLRIGVDDGTQAASNLTWPLLGDGARMVLQTAPSGRGVEVSVWAHHS
jgi:hypothetical protein